MEDHRQEREDHTGGEKLDHGRAGRCDPDTQYGVTSDGYPDSDEGTTCDESEPFRSINTHGRSLPSSRRKKTKALGHSLLGWPPQGLRGIGSRE